MSMPALTVGPGLRCNIDTTWCAKVACLLSSGLPYAAEITHIQRLNPGWRATSIIELYIWLSVDPGSLSLIYTIPSVAEYMDVAEGGLGSGYWDATARPPTTYRCNIFHMTTYPWGQFLFCASHPSTPQPIYTQTMSAPSRSKTQTRWEAIWLRSCPEQRLGDIELPNVQRPGSLHQRCAKHSYSIANCLQRLSHLASYQHGTVSRDNHCLTSVSVTHYSPERTSVMRKVHALERQDLIEEMRIACMASDITRLPTLPQLIGPPSPHDCTVAYIELGSAPLCVLLGVSTD
ncbi:hypothetical protein FAUST_8390 [Fusarium austroamericanum]|uniref:Uncharacterized protein n=1 Tax=Fusarium austroamericanum TaxID=282268 RepID=A0AAN5Z4Q5_FUSAU|nr:hypothetical protein FAUST_8390 [Fusarium austroamericanum]